MKAFLTVIGNDRVGIIAQISAFLAQNNVNILDITQTVLRSYFTMVMFIDISNASKDICQMQEELSKICTDLEIRIQCEDIFNSMHRL